MTGLDKFANLLAVEHELKDIPRFGEEELDRQGRLLTLGSFPRGMMVNPHFFGEIPPAPRNREPVFITVGSLSAQRKNHELLVEALETVYHEGHRDFSVIIVGEGELGEIPGHLRPFLHVAGKLDFPAMYEAMRRADYFLPLLDPGNPAHDRYITTGITGSALLIYGFAKIPVIHEKFASFYGFNDRNALLYGEETLGGAMLRAIRQTEEEYAEMQQALLQLGRDIDRESRSNLKRALARHSPRFPSLFPFTTRNDILKSASAAYAGKPLRSGNASSLTTVPPTRRGKSPGVFQRRTQESVILNRKTEAFPPPEIWACGALPGAICVSLTATISSTRPFSNIFWTPRTAEQAI